MSLKPELCCLQCIHSTGANCELSRIGYPYVGDWCAAFAEGKLPEPQEKAIQTPEAVPSEH